MDYRIQEIVDAWILRNGLLGRIDRISFGGPCKDREEALKYIRICCQKHGVTNVYISQHEDCAGYGGHEAFSSLEEEHDTILGDMKLLRDDILKEFPEVEVTMLLVSQDGKLWQINEVS
jgi:hypothetical protein